MEKYINPKYPNSKFLRHKTDEEISTMRRKAAETNKSKKHKRSKEFGEKMSLLKSGKVMPKGFVEKRKATLATKSIEDIQVSKDKQSKSFKEWWSNSDNKEKIKERNKKLSESGKGKIRSEESKRKQALANTGKKQSPETLRKRAINRQEKAERGEYMGVKCKYYKVGDYQCQGKSEKSYVEGLYDNNFELPLRRGNFVETPFGVYHPDFEFNDYLIEIKSEYTFKILTGEQKNIDDKYSCKQLDKMKWVNENYKPVKIIVINNKGVQREVEVERISFTFVLENGTIQYE